MVGHREDEENGGETLKVTWQLATRWQNLGGPFTWLFSLQFCPNDV